MSQEPQIQARPARHYAAIPATVTMEGISGAVDDAFPALFGWLAGQGVAPSGPPFIRYLVIDMAAEHGTALDSRDTARGTAWGCRAEHYLTDPSAEPDPAKWEVDIAYLISGA